MLNIGVVMDPIARIKPYKDTTFAIMLEAQRRGHKVHYMEPSDIYLQNGQPHATVSLVKVWDRASPEDTSQFFGFGETRDIPLSSLDIILIRQDPPFNNDYLYCTHFLELAEAQGVLVVNKPQSLRDANEKLFASWFPQCTPPTLVSANANKLKAFVAEQQDTIFKPLDAMGGASIFRVKAGDPNVNVIMEVMTGLGRHAIMAQTFLPEISEGDKRILLIHGEPIPYALARIPQPGETRGNIAVGGRTEGRELSARDRWLCEQIKPVIQQKGLHLVGLDVIGDYITEINVTSPTGMRELDRLFDLNIAGTLWDHLESHRA